MIGFEAQYTTNLVWWTSSFLIVEFFDKMKHRKYLEKIYMFEFEYEFINMFEFDFYLWVCLILQVNNGFQLYEIIKTLWDP